MIAIVYLLLLFLPGGIIVFLHNIQSHRFLKSLAISVGFLFLTQLPFRYGGGEILHWLYFYLASVLFVWVVVLWRSLVNKRNYFRVTIVSDANSTAMMVFIMGLVGCIILWSLLYLWIGPYTEIPADYWAHLQRMSWEYNAIRHRNIPSYASSIPPITLLNREYVHGLHAGIQYLFKLTPEQITPISQWVMSSIFVAALYCFFYPQLSTKWGDVKRTYISILATVLTVVWMGTGAFAFIRYYAMAPVILTFPLYLLGVLIFIDFLKKADQCVVKTFSFLGFILFLMALLHIQEAIFLCLTLLVISFVARFQIRGYADQLWHLYTHQKIQKVALILFVGMMFFIGFALIFLKPATPTLGVILQPATNLPFLRDLWVIDPGRQVWATITAGGAIACVLLIFFMREMREYPYIIATMILPWVTLFNPIFIHVWERILSDHLLWRLSMLMPAGFVAAVAVGALMSHRPSKVWWIKIMLTVLCIALMLPISALHSKYTINRAYSFVPLEKDQSEQWLLDLVDYLRLQPSQRIATDPVTAYVLRGLTFHRVPGKKFYLGLSDVNFNQLPFEQLLETLNKTKSLVVINHRDGDISKTGPVLKHWANTALKVSRYYQEGIVENLKENGYKVVWSQNEITVLKTSF